MASTWSALKIELLETGANSGTWGTLTNVNLGDAVLGEAITGSATVDFPTDADVTVTLTDSATSQSARNLRLNITESSTGIGSVRSLILGSGCQIEKFYLINNTGTGAKTVKNTTGTGISVPAGKATLVYNNGTNVVDAASYFTSLTLGSALPVASGGTGLSSGTSGGVLAYTATGTLASSAALAASALVIGGGAGAAPSTTTTGTGVVTALGVNTGTAGAFVVNGGALGTPSSGTVTNLTGTASININGTVGATTATTGAFTTVTASGQGAINSAIATNSTFQISGTYAGTGGLFDGGLFVNVDGGTMGVNRTISQSYFGYGPDNAASTITTAASGTNDISTTTIFPYVITSGGATLTNATTLAINDAPNLGTNKRALWVKAGLSQLDGGLAVTGTLSATGTLSGGTSGTAYSFSGSAPATSLTLDSSGNLGVGTASPASGGKLAVAGNGAFTGSNGPAGNTQGVRILTSNTSGDGVTIDSFCYGSNGYGPLYLNTGNAGTPVMTLNVAGNVGIGTSSPAEKLHVVGKIAVSGTNPSIRQTVQNAYLDLCGGTTVGTDPAIQIAGSTTTSDANKIFYNSNTHLFRTSSGGTTYATIDTSGNLGLGATPNAWAGTALQVDPYGGFGVDANGNTIVASNAWNYTSSAYKYSASSLGASLYQQSFGAHSWSIAASGTAGNPISFTQAMTLDASGNLLVGTTALSNRLSVVAPSGQYVARFGLNGTGSQSFINFVIGEDTTPTGVGSVTYNGTTTLYNATSDQRLKENIVDAGTALATLNQIKVRAFDWIESKTHETHGVVAQELKEVAPQCVTEGINHQDGSIDRPWQVDTSPLVPMLIKAIQEQQALITQLTARITALETA